MVFTQGTREPPPTNASRIMVFTQGTREPPPTISTKPTSSTETPLASFADSRTARTRSIIGWHMLAKSARLIMLAKSSSSMRHSTFTGASLFADKTFLVFVTASSSLSRAFLLDRTSQPTFFLNCAANSRIRHSSISRPPTLSDRSQRTDSLPLTNWTNETEIIAAVDTVCQRGSGVLIHDAKNGKVRDLRCIEYRLSLHIREAARHGNDCISHFRLAPRLGDLLQLGDVHGRYLRGRERPGLPFILDIVPSGRLS